MLRVSAIMGIVSGLLLALAETFNNWGQWQWWPWWLVDYVAAGLLITGGFLVLRALPYGGALLTAGWGFTLGMAWMSLAGNIEAGVDSARDGRVGGYYLMVIGFGIAYCAAGLLLALRGTDLRP